VMLNANYNSISVRNVVFKRYKLFLATDTVTGSIVHIKQIQRPSDAPLDSALVMNWKAYNAQVERWQNNIRKLKTVILMQNKT